MFLGVVIFAVAAVLVIGVWFSLRSQRRDYEATGGPEDRLSDEDFRRIEFGDDDI